MDRFVFFDVEYANTKNKAICQMGIICKDLLNSEEHYPKLDLYVNPEDEFDDMCIRVHGITKARVASAPNFANIWPKVEEYFTNAIIIGHNVANADLDALEKDLRRYNLDIPELYYIDTYELARTFIQRSDIPSYGLGSLCKHFGIAIDNEHNAYYDAYANAELFDIIVDTYHIDINAFVRKYAPHENYVYTAYISSPILRKKITELYGVLRGFSIDNEISEKEADYLIQWKEDNTRFASQEEIAVILSAITSILSDGLVTLQEVLSLQRMIKKYLDIVDSSPITLATQILDGIMKGIIHDGEITVDECQNLRTWMYDNIYLSGHFPFNRLLEILDRVLEDGVITEEESKEIMTTINELLNPIENTRRQICEIDGKHICLSGDFKYGRKADVEKVLTSKGAIVESSVKKTTDILMVGDSECSSFSNGTYGTKVKKAMEYNEKGSNILIIKESDYFN